jgi:hypothetical protein
MYRQPAQRRIEHTGATFQAPSSGTEDRPDQRMNDSPCAIEGPANGGNHHVEARAKGESGHTSPVRVITTRSIDAATGAVVGRILRAWYGNLNVAADALGADRRDLWRWCVGREPMPARVIAAMAARVDQAEAYRKRVIRSRVAKAQRQADNDLARLPEVWSRLGYVPAERARLIRQGDRRRAASRKRGLRQ